ncbi:unnamed protein product [Adineta ricciae]|uniref:Chitin-binding type-3 domain-containing protein n=2 Tax=Adineta ricciae TaxID=249248 RepID=A0A813NUN0_ADIRI|nr:unnamed protein product [Adineta ricciae]
MGTLLALTILFSYCLVSLHGHGYLLEPVARSSAWLVDSSFRECCTWPQHMEMFCGGLGHQWNVNDGKCSICGEAYDKPIKVFEKGGAMYKGTIVKTYNQGQQIDVKVVLTANHKGYFEFRLCNLDASPSADASQECLDRHLLKIADTDSTRFRDVDKYGSEMITLHTDGNSWGTDPSTGQSGAGLGRENETFMGCSDITILTNGSPIDPPMVIIPTAPTRISTTTTTSVSSSSSNPSTWWPTNPSTWSSKNPSTWWPTNPSTWSSKNPSTWWPTNPSTWSSKNPSTWWPTNPSTWSSKNPSTWWPTNPSTWWSTPTPTNSASKFSTTTTTARPPLGLTTWSADLFDYQIGDEVMYDGVKYRCIAPHRSYRGAEPGLLTWAWWERIEESEEAN